MHDDVIDVTREQSKSSLTNKINGCRHSLVINGLDKNLSSACNTCKSSRHYHFTSHTDIKTILKLQLNCSICCNYGKRKDFAQLWVAN